MKRSLVLMTGLMALMLSVTACGGTTAPAAGSGSSTGQETKIENTHTGPKLSGEIRIDGSSTVFPITEAVAEEFMKIHKDVKISVGFSGTSGGFKKWLRGETDINNSSRAIKPNEVDEAKKAGIEYFEIPVAYDGLSVVVNKENTWLTCITVDELNKIWNKDSTAKRWNEINPAWPNEEFKLYGPGTDSGTFDYFTEFVNKKSGNSRSDFTASEDDHVLVEGVAGNKNSMGYFGYAYYVESQSKMRALAVDGGKGCVEPKDQSIADLTYPIARFIYIHPTKAAMARPEVTEFVRFYLQNAPALVKQVGYTPLGQKLYEAELAKLK